MRSPVQNSKGDDRIHTAGCWVGGNQFPADTGVGVGFGDFGVGSLGELDDRPKPDTRSTDKRNGSPLRQRTAAALRSTCY